ncbi:hypothetical protein Tsubulata_018649 [Turnera subulata]|uniref:DUF3615 domain-containing protein n=1 Tax=Turnera subulata TaxID=218843 RepID=A0A9Q0J2S0_9ROSI|nr:hypothetical protein Tsubulata_018649 [Turnera subulata]
MEGGGRAPPRARAISRYNLRSLISKSPDREKLRREALATLRNFRGVLVDHSGLLRPDDPEVKRSKDFEVTKYGTVIKIPRWKPPRSDPETEEKEYQDQLDMCRPFAVKALELYQKENEPASDEQSTNLGKKNKKSSKGRPAFELLDMQESSAQVRCGGLVWHLKFTAKPLGSQDGTTKTFFAQVHGRRGKVHANLCFTLDSPILRDPDFVIEDNGDWVEYPYDCPACYDLLESSFKSKRSKH